MNSGSGGAAWIPRLLIRRQSSNAPLVSTFAAMMTPYQGKPKVIDIRRLRLETEAGLTYPEANVAIEIQFIDGHKDPFVALDVENPLGLPPSRITDPIAIQQEWGTQLNGELCWIRQSRDDTVERTLQRPVIQR